MTTQSRVAEIFMLYMYQDRSRIDHHVYDEYDKMR